MSRAKELRTFAFEVAASRGKKQFWFRHRPYPTLAAEMLIPGPAILPVPVLIFNSVGQWDEVKWFIGPEDLALNGMQEPKPVFYKAVWDSDRFEDESQGSVLQPGLFNEGDRIVVMSAGLDSRRLTRKQ